MAYNYVVNLVQSIVVTSIHLHVLLHKASLTSLCPARAYKTGNDAPLTMYNGGLNDMSTILSSSLTCNLTDENSHVIDIYILSSRTSLYWHLYIYHHVARAINGRN